MSSPFTKARKLPFICNCWFPKPILHPTKNNCIIISTSNRENAMVPGIHKYNIATNESEILYKCNGDMKFKPRNHGIFIHPLNNSLILLGGSLKSQIAMFDFNSKQLNKYNASNAPIEFYPKSALIPSPINQIHITDRRGDHYIFDTGIKNQKTIKLQSNSIWKKSSDIACPIIFYIDSHKKMFAFPEHDEKKRIFEYDMNKWTVSKLQMPDSMNDYDILKGFQNIIFVFYFQSQEIYLLDLLYLKWY
eukprot:515917_1